MLDGTIEIITATTLKLEIMYAIRMQYFNEPDEGLLRSRRSCLTCLQQVIWSRVSYACAGVELPY